MHPRSRPRIRSLLIVIVTVALLAAGCASGPDGVDAPASETDVVDSSSTAAPASGDVTDENEDGESEPSASGIVEPETAMAASSPIGAFFADGGGFEAALEEYTAQGEEEIVRCMAEQGFEFAPPEEAVAPRSKTRRTT